jgi:hypothetical protein
MPVEMDPKTIILTSIKKMLGMEASYVAFDTDIIILINSAFMVLNQLGVGPSAGFSISSGAELWSAFITDATIIEEVKAYVYLKVKLIFDPPTSAAVIQAFKEAIAEAESRMNTQVEYLAAQAAALLVVVDPEE